MENLLVVIFKFQFYLQTNTNTNILFSEEFVPLTKVNVGYIVYGVALNELGQVLMMQEAKPLCKGQWYLPAGRLDPNESIIVSNLVYNMHVNYYIMIKVNYLCKLKFTLCHYLLLS